MKNRLLKGLAIVFSLVTISASMSTAVYAGDTEMTTDSSGNTFIAGTDIGITTDVGNELFMAGQDVKADGVDVAGSVFAAGMNVNIKDGSVRSSIFAAGMNVNIDSDAENNIWACGQSVSIGEKVSVKALHVAAASVSAKGEYDYAMVCGDTIYFDGTVNGDADFEGNVTFGPNTSISGKVKVSGAKEPVLETGASVSDIDFTLIDNSSKKDDESAGEVVTEVAKKSIGFIILSKVKKFIYWALAYSVMALVFAVVFKKELNESYDMSIKESPLAFWLSGAIGFIFVPLALIILCITLIGAPLAAFTGAIYVLALCAARVFTFGSLVRELIFSHTKKRFNPLLETVLAVLIAALVKLIPVLSGVVGVICKVYLLGYISQKVYERLKKDKVETVEE